MCKIPKYVLLDTLITFLILLIWSDDSSQHGGQNHENPQKMHDTNL